jgi:hypothetical protein
MAAAYDLWLAHAVGDASPAEERRKANAGGGKKKEQRKERKHMWVTVTHSQSMLVRGIS